MHARRVYIQVFPIIFIIAVEYLLVATRCSICRVSLFSLVFVRLLYLSCSLAIVRSFLPSLCHASVVQLFPTDGFSLFLLCRSCVMSLFCLLIVVIVSSCRLAWNWLSTDFLNCGASIVHYVFIDSPATRKATEKTSTSLGVWAVGGDIDPAAKLPAAPPGCPKGKAPWSSPSGLAGLRS